MTKPTNFVFAVDLDGVCADFYRGIRPFAAEWLGVEETKLADDVTFHLAEWGMTDGPGGYYDFHKWAVTQRDLFTKLTPILGCPQVLRRLSKAQIRIRIVTHRTFVSYFHVPAIQQTIEWLDSHGIPYWDLCFMGDKAQVGAHIYVEDAPENIKRLLAQQCEVIIFANSTNREFEGNRQRVETWDEVERLVMQEFDKWQSDVEKASQPRPPSVLPKNK